MNNVIKIYSAVNVKSFVTLFWTIIGLAVSVIASIFAYTLIKDGYWKISFFTLPFILLSPYIIFFIICQPDRKLVQKFSLRYGFLLGNSIYVVGYREFEVGNMIT